MLIKFRLKASNTIFLSVKDPNCCINSGVIKLRNDLNNDKMNASI